MTITKAEIKATIERYINRNPDEGTELLPLLTTVEDSKNVCSRYSFPLHITCGAAVINDCGDVLMIHHRALDKWMLPGGHIEPGDLNLISACLRELREETDVRDEAAFSPIGMDMVPIDIDIHRIPENPAKGEPAHWHADMRYVFKTTYPVVNVQLEEVSAHAWHSPLNLHTPRLVRKVTLLTETELSR
ncbi:NUDIX hydrolase [Microbispora bryophytorum]|uniref:NUDIX hydrolase n=1 Tax=Microbispora bryophytorum TaxID=1460882 RepID=UPI0033DC012B